MRTPMVNQCWILAVFALHFAPLLLGVAGKGNIGINYSQDLSRNEINLEQLQSYGIDKVKIYSSDSEALRSLAHSNVEVVVGLPDDDLLAVGESKEMANLWISRNILPYITWTRITDIAVGNEVLTKDKTKSQVLVQAMRNIYSALVSVRLHKDIKVSSPQSFLLLDHFSPPSSAFFRGEYLDILREYLQFLSEIEAPLMLNVYPSYLYQSSVQDVSLDYYLLKQNPGFDDLGTGLHYDNYLDEILDAVTSAMGVLNHSDIPIIVTESRWQSPYEIFSQLHNQNLGRYIQRHSGTPLRPDSEVVVYVSNYLSVSMLTLDKITDSGRPHARRLATTTQTAWCIGKPNLSDTLYQGALDWACGTGSNQGQVNCGPIQQGQSCYYPNTVYDHASWAFNAYFNTHNATNSSCDFQGTAEEVFVDPSTSNCTYQGSNVTVTVSSNGTVVPTPPGSSSGAATLEPHYLFHISSAILLMNYLFTGQLF